MHWNHRIVNMSHTDGEGPWYEVREVYYEDDGSMAGHSRPCLGDEDPEQIVGILLRMTLDIQGKEIIKPPALLATQEALARAKGGQP
jgi:hypothetical protein